MAAWLLLAALQGEDLHVLRVVDEATGRGVPLVELETTNKIRLVTDSGGVAVFDEPGLLGRSVWFHVAADGYEHAADGFGFRGARVETAPGKTTTLKVRRLLAAERLYRVTGQGIYAETLKAGGTAPIRDPALNDGGVLGQDTVQTILWKDALWWFWGDTDRAAYPLGQFRTSGATSLPPGRGGLDPDVGVDLRYRTDAQGFSRPMVELPDPEGPIWIDGLMLLRDPAGQERLLANYVVVKSLTEPVRRGLCVWDEKAERFGPLSTYPVDEPLHPAGQPIRHEGRFYFPSPYAMIRVQADWAAVQDPRRYEAFTCLKPGARDAREVERDASGAAVWDWKKDTGPAEEKTLKPEDAWQRVRDVDGRRVTAHMGTTSWNAHRRKWIAVFHEHGGKPSFLGEVWYAEADRPWGPFERGVKIATHRRHSFYNVVHHPDFDQDGGRRIYFEGTYTKMFTDIQVGTPRYEYNQIMYRLDLDDPRLAWAQRR